jgi:glycogen synthase
LGKHASLRILLVSREYPPETGGGGIGSYAEIMARALVARGHEVHVLSCVDGQADEDEMRAGVHLHRRGVSRFMRKIRRRLPGTAARIEGALARSLAARRLETDFDVVEAPDWMAEGLAFAVRRTRPLVVHLHTPLTLIARHNPRSFQWSRDAHMAAALERFTVQRAHVVTSPSRLLSRDLASEGWLEERNVRVIRYPVDIDMWGPLPSADSAEPRILAVGRLEARKAPELLVRAASLLAPEFPALDVVFIGRSGLRNGGEYRDWLVDLARELSVPCRFVDEVDRSELGAWYASARVVAIPSRYDNFPYSGLEAMAAGRPLVCTDATGTAELLAGSAAGQVVPTNNPEALARALRPYLLDPAHAVRAGLEARSLVERHCSPDRIAGEREACYRDVIHQSRGKLRDRSRRAGNATLSPR